ncbi:hypothetical protein Gpo141_00010354 [Globisporangium polare]
MTTGMGTAAEVEREPSPTNATVDAPGRKDEKGVRSSSRLLEHAFGTQMLLGRDEWADVADVIRSSFLVVAKELKRHDRRMRVLEANSSLHKDQPQQEPWKQMEMRMQQTESEQSDRWSAMQTQMALLRDELQLLVQQLQQLKESEVSVQKQQFAARPFVALEMEKTSTHCEQRHARLKKRLAGIEQQTKRALERDDTTQTRLHSAENQLSTLATELQQPKKGSSSSSSNPPSLSASPQESTAVRELLVAQAQCKEEIRRLQHTLVAHDQRAVAQAREIKRRLAQVSIRNDDRVVVASQALLQADKLEARESKLPSVSREGGNSEPRSEGVPAALEGDVKTQQQVPAAKSTEASTFGSHTTLKERYARAREKQQESLSQLRRRQQQKQ